MVPRGLLAEQRGEGAEQKQRLAETSAFFILKIPLVGFIKIYSSAVTVKFLNLKLALSPRIPPLPGVEMGAPPMPLSAASTSSFPSANNSIVTDPSALFFTVASTFCHVLYGTEAATRDCMVKLVSL